MVTPSYMLAIADEMEVRVFLPRMFSQDRIFGAEPWTNELRAKIEHAPRCRLATSRLSESRRRRGAGVRRDSRRPHGVG